MTTRAWNAMSRMASTTTLSVIFSLAITFLPACGKAERCLTQREDRSESGLKLQPARALPAWLHAAKRLPTMDRMDDESLQLLQKFQDGDEGAADAIFHRYVNRLIGLARNHISSGLARRVDAEDIVQSVYRSFFVAANEEGRFQIERSGDLWRLLAAITINKTRKKARFHGQQKRTMGQEEPIVDGLTSELASGPEGVEVVAALEELEAVMQSLDERGRQILELRFQGQSLEEIAQQVGRSQRTVRRNLEEAEQRLQQRLTELGSG